MSKLKIRIGKKAVARDIRAGLDDAELMRTYGLSARGLQKLFAKLAATGQISQAELDQRALRSQRSHAVELVDLPESPTVRALISTPRALEDIRAQMSDTELMEKYNLSARGLENLFRRLVETGALSRSDVYSRNMYGRKRVGVASHEDNFRPGDPLGGEPLPVRILGRYRVLFAGIAGLLGGMLLVGAIVVLGYGVSVLPGKLNRDARSELETTTKALQKQAEEMIAILEEIIRLSPSPALSGMVSGELFAEEYQQCLDDCEKSLPRSDEMEKVLVLNCKKGCIGRYSDRVKKIRQRFY